MYWMFDEQDGLAIDSMADFLKGVMHAVCPDMKAEDSDERALVFAYPDSGETSPKKRKK